MSHSHKTPPPIGWHLLADFHGVPSAQLTDPHRLEALLRQAAKAAGAIVLFGHFHHFGAGSGVTGVLLLMESHISIHTWPEHGFAAIDIFMCGEAKPDLALTMLKNALHPSRSKLSRVRRG
ncbi:adenosylmethionine decarboxylase [Crenobacter cavernae]|uniref:S-adenosylmethionine decarboxylase proenzyme n=1 Tax=Crenobacter cavernae TaxID=2290923 RepID=A0A345Y941_9NEIS|nr:adenosylmethionine decarboxylase [Crenobacter cavernae]AXK40443.1 adenosylmethionine decarboxylase [Crenobacter cavernae]RXZ42524.1 adenosylmethionine decarboxylase [Crenobacter cavernae]